MPASRNPRAVPDLRVAPAAGGALGVALAVAVDWYGAALSADTPALDLLALLRSGDGQAHIAWQQYPVLPDAGDLVAVENQGNWTPTLTAGGRVRICSIDVEGDDAAGEVDLADLLAHLLVVEAVFSEPAQHWMVDDAAHDQRLVLDWLGLDESLLWLRTVLAGDGWFAIGAPESFVPDRFLPAMAAGFGQRWSLR